VTDEDRLLLLQGIQYPYQVAYQMKEGILVCLGRPISPAIASQIGRHDMVARLAEHLELESPAVPEFREAMAQQDQRAGSHLSKMDANTVDLHKPVGDLRWRDFWGIRVCTHIAIL
jgi:hypothetical protein